MVQPARPACAHDAVATVRSSVCWIARTQVPCFACVRLSDVLGLILPADSAIDRHDSGSPRPALPCDEIKYFQLIYVRRISAPTLEDIVQLYCGDIEHLYEDYDLRLDRRYIMNHCDRCGARFSDAKLFAPPGALFNRPRPARRNRIALHRCAIPVVATGCMAPIADHVAAAIEAAAHGLFALPA